jgi:hypothetical protein
VAKESSSSFIKQLDKILLLLIILIPFMKGLFFKEAFIPAFFLITVLFIILIKKSKVFIFDKKILIIFILTFLSSFISIFTGINKEKSIYGFFLDMFPMFIFFLYLNMPYNLSLQKSGEQLSKESPGTDPESSPALPIHKFMWVFFISGTFISIMNFYIGIMYNDSLKGLRFNLFIPYENTLAVYLFACSVAGIYLMQAQMQKTLPLQKTAICINMAAMFFTLSRTMWILAVFLYIFYLILLKAKKTTVSFGLILLVTFLDIAVISYLPWKTGWLIFLLNPLLFVSFDLLYRFLRQNFKFKSFTKTPIIILAVSAAVLIFFLLVLTSGTIRERVMSINLNAQELLERFAYYRDAPSIIKDYPIFGTGHGGWASIQYKYQTAIYSVEYIHSSIIQAFVDHGFIGLLIFLMQCAVFLYYSIKAFRNSTGKHLKAGISCLIIINASILMHSVSDIDFEYPVINMLFWIVVAYLVRFSGIKPVEIRLGSIKRFVAISASTLLIICLLPLYISNFYYLKGTKYTDDGLYINASICFKKAARFNPFSSDALYMEGNVLGETYKQLSDKDDVIKSIDCVNAAQKLDKYNPQYPTLKEQTFSFFSDYQKSIDECRQLLVLQPLIIYNYEALSDSLIKNSEKLYDEGFKNTAMEGFTEVTQIETQISLASKKISKAANKLKHKPILTITPLLAYNIGEAYCYLSDFIKAGKYISMASTDESLLLMIDELQERFKNNTIIY